jgi:hypothetical protein
VPDLPPQRLVYVREQGSQLTIVSVAADGTGPIARPLPPGASLPVSLRFPADLAAAVSPDGRWVAFYTGSAGEAGHAASGPFDLALNLLRLADGQVVRLTSLLSPDYPDNFRQVAAQLMAQDPQNYPADFDWAGLLQSICLSGIRSLDWSPDGRHLAFAGEMDGPSSDVYVYDLETGAIRRLTDGPSQVQWLAWSPDGRWILHSAEGTYALAGSSPDFYAAAADGSGVKDLRFSGEFAGWLGPGEALLNAAANGPGKFDLQAFDLEQGRVTPIWMDQFEAFALDPQADVLAVSRSFSLHTTADPDTERGLFFVDRAAGEPWLAASGTWMNVVFWGAPVLRFVAMDVQQRTVAVAGDGAVTALSDEALWPVPSPDRRWLALYGGVNAAGLELFDDTGRLVRRASDEVVNTLAWRPDSAGLFFAAGGELDYVAVAGGDPVAIDPDLTYGASLAWTPRPDR